MDWRDSKFLKSKDPFPFAGFTICPRAFTAILIIKSGIDFKVTHWLRRMQMISVQFGWLLDSTGLSSLPAGGCRPSTRLFSCHHMQLPGQDSKGRNATDVAAPGY